MRNRKSTLRALESRGLFQEDDLAVANVARYPRVGKSPRGKREVVHGNFDGSVEDRGSIVSGPLGSFAPVRHPLLRDFRPLFSGTCQQVGHAAFPEEFALSGGYRAVLDNSRAPAAH